MSLTRPRHHPLLTLAISLALFMEAVDTTILNTAIPAMAHSLKVSPIDLKIALISYLLSLAMFIPISGWMADKFGLKRVFILALTVFTLSSIWCGFAHNLIQLVLARSLQGLGGSLTMPLGRLLIVRTFARHELITTMNRIVMVAALGLMLGPVLGGFITHYLSWHWIFWVNAPVGVLTLLLAYRVFPCTPSIPVPRLDKVGFILFGCGLAGFTFGLSALSETNVPPWVAIATLLISSLLFMGYIWHSTGQPHPVVNTRLFSFRTFQISVLGNLLARLGFGGVPFLLPLLFQIGLGLSAQVSGLLMAPAAFGVLLVKPLSLPALRLVGYKRLFVSNTFFVGLSLWSFMTINANTSLLHIGCLTFIFGFLISLQYSAINSLAYADISSNELSAATSIISTLQQIAQSFGVAVSALLVRLFALTAHGEMILSVTVMDDAFFSMGILTFLSIFTFLKLGQEDGYQLIKPQES
ncbi:MAG: multidrug transporter [Gammaproteobacteria bacterium RIFCSPHIGHO2_12_FULL_45_12]|nr:MAG: multidrug transporter [Gammaproteobacteria bacterium RIFCSPHIGHO2_12_FULL_45_12]